jgi:NADPH-dependent curcumin reductase CurA
MSRTGAGPAVAREWVLDRLLDGPLRPEDLRLRTTELGPLQPGEVLVRNEFMSVDPAIRLRMDRRRGGSGAYPEGEPMGAKAVGVVLDSAAAGVPVGARVVTFLGFRDVAVARADELEQVDDVVGVHPAENALTALGNPGLTAWVGLTLIARLEAGETLLVSSAAGGIGSLALQIGRLRGARVIGSAGTADKVRWLTEELGADAAFDYHAESPGAALDRLAPEGLDVYFDNTGGPLLEAAVPRMRRRGRIAHCGSVSGYDGGGSPLRIDDVARIVQNSVTLRGYLVDDHRDAWPRALEELRGWLTDGRLHAPHTILEGLDSVPEALSDVLRPAAAHRGKLLVRLN